MSIKKAESMTDLNDTIFQLIASQLCGETLSPKEEELINAWRTANSDNEEQYLHFRSILLRRHELKRWDQVTRQTSIALHRVHNRLFKKRFLRFTRYAAIVVPLIIGSIVLYTYIHQDYVEVTPEQAVHPEVLKQAKAFLQLENGEKIALTDSIIPFNKEANIRLSQDGALLYSTDTTLDHHPPVYHLLQVDRGSDFKIILADGTEVWLNSESELRYPSRFSDSTRQVYLTGEAYFAVSKNEQQPFIVSTSNCTIEVLGTEFNVSSYANEKKTVTTLISGKITYNTASNKGELLPGEQCIYSETTQTTEIRKVNVHHYISWKNGLFVFEQTTLKELSEQIIRWYDIKVHFDSPSVEVFRFTGAIERNRPIEFLVNILNATNTIQCRMEEETLILAPKKQ